MAARSQSKAPRRSSTLLDWFRRSERIAEAMVMEFTDLKRVPVFVVGVNGTKTHRSVEKQSEGLTTEDPGGAEENVNGADVMSPS